MNLTFPGFNHALIAFSEEASGSLSLLPKQRLGVTCFAQGHLWVCFREVTAFLNHFSIQSRGSDPHYLRAPTTYQLQTLQLLQPQADLLPRDPVHLQSMRVSGYCIFSIDVPNDMTITDAGHESKVLNHPPSWCVQQVLLSDLNVQAPHRNAHRVGPALVSWCLVSAASFLPGAGLHLSLAWTTLTIPALCELSSRTQWPHQINKAWEEGEGKIRKQKFCTAYQSITLVPFYLARVRLEKHKSTWKIMITHVLNMLNFNW